MTSRPKCDAMAFHDSSRVREAGASASGKGAGRTSPTPEQTTPRRAANTQAFAGIRARARQCPPSPIRADRPPPFRPAGGLLMTRRSLRLWAASLGMLVPLATGPSLVAQAPIDPLPTSICPSSLGAWVATWPCITSTSRRRAGRQRTSMPTSAPGTASSAIRARWSGFQWRAAAATPGPTCSRATTAASSSTSSGRRPTAGRRATARTKPAAAASRAIRSRSSPIPPNATRCCTCSDAGASCRPTAPGATTGCCTTGRRRGCRGRPKT